MRSLLITAMLLAPAPLVAQPQEASVGKAKAVYESLVAEYSHAQQEYRQAGAGLSREERAKLESPVVDFLPVFQEAAKEYVGTESAVQFLAWIVMNGAGDEEVLKLAQVLVVERPGFSRDRIQALYKSKMQFVETPLLDIASTTIRQRVHDGKPIRFFVPDPVVEYIEAQTLYR